MFDNTNNQTPSSIDAEIAIAERSFSAIGGNFYDMSVMLAALDEKKKPSQTTPEQREEIIIAQAIATLINHAINKGVKLNGRRFKAIMETVYETFMQDAIKHKYENNPSDDATKVLKEIIDQALGAYKQ